jgi:PAS domain S-box-containing protein
VVTLGEILRWIVYTIGNLYTRLAARLLRRDKLLVRQEHKFRALLESAPDAMVIIDWHGHVNVVNAQTERLFGYTREELIGQNLTDLLSKRHRDDHREFQQDYMRRAQGEEEHTSTVLDLEGLRKDGSEFPIEISISLLQTDGGLLISNAIRDVTERKRIEAELIDRAQALERSNADLEQFAYVASHDLQAPLRVVAGFVDLLRRRYRDQLDSDADKFIDYAVDGVERMQRLIDDLLAYSRLRIDGEKDLKPVDFNDTVEDVLADLREEISESDARVSVGDLPTVKAEPSQIGQVFQNLISNAVKFSNTEAPEVEVSAERENGMWRIDIADNGIGIDPQHRERVFEMFQRLHTPDEFPGTGIGLAICKRIVEHHGGHISADSGPGGGTVMSFTLPASEPETG